jgi:hypothetical protein
VFAERIRSNRSSFDQAKNSTCNAVCQGDHAFPHVSVAQIRRTTQRQDGFEAGQELAEDQIVTPRGQFARPESIGQLLICRFSLIRERKKVGGGWRLTL